MRRGPLPRALRATPRVPAQPQGQMWQGGTTSELGSAHLAEGALRETQGEDVQPPPLYLEELYP